MPTDASVKAAAWQLYEATAEALRYLDTAADRGGIECRRILRNAILTAGAELPDDRGSGEEAWKRLK
jgi:hypothetical protein